MNDPYHIHAAHCLLYSKIEENDNILSYFALGQLRHDGALGFPGGVVSEASSVTCRNDIIKELKRELEEEIDYRIQDDNNSFVHVSTLHRIETEKKKEWILHFFIKEIKLEELEQCERHHMKGIHFPSESLGLFRIPIIDPVKCQQSNLFKHYQTFMDSFLQHVFAGKLIRK